MIFRSKSAPASRKSMSRLINIHTHSASGDSQILEIVNQYPLEFQDGFDAYSIGIHPWKISIDSIEEELSIIESKMSDPCCLAIGECGLDKRIHTPLELQEEVFEKQLLLAKRYRKPVIIHCVAAYSEVIALRKKLEIDTPMIIHGFSKNIQTANQLLDNGFYLSFGKYLLRNPELSKVFGSVPDDRFFLETDTIEEPLSEVYRVAADAKNIDLAQLKSIVNANFAAVFSEID